MLNEPINIKPSVSLLWHKHFRNSSTFQNCPRMFYFPSCPNFFFLINLLLQKVTKTLHRHILKTTAIFPCLSEGHTIYKDHDNILISEARLLNRPKRRLGSCSVGKAPAVVRAWVQTMPIKVSWAWRQQPCNPVCGKERLRTPRASWLATAVESASSGPKWDPVSVYTVGSNGDTQHQHLASM